MISFKSVRKSFAGIPLLKNISFELKQGEKVSLLGPGACGKSTILKMLLGLEKPDQGEIQLLECDMINAPEPEKQKTLRNVGMAFQQSALFDFMTVEENLNFAMENMTDFSKTKMDEKIEYLLRTVKLPRTRNMFPFELSGGMQRRIGVARALATEPILAIFDEPTAGLDPVTSTIILNMINELIDLRSDKSMLVSTSSVEIAIRFADRVIIVHEGRIVGDGQWRDLLINGQEWVRYFLGIRLKGIDIRYAKELHLPKEFIEANWKT
ncbi:MAG: ATP-binding cassette domain-containing protein [Oligoflexales bacterium]|nr:ATP-binding cassette domain-containing protein [Oligoflexales bacterium]